MSTLHQDLTVTCSGCSETFGNIHSFKAHRRTGRCGGVGRMKKAIGFVLAGWPFMILLGTLLHEAYQDIGIGGIVIMLAGFFVAGCSVWVGLNLAFPMKGEM